MNLSAIYKPMFCLGYVVDYSAKVKSVDLEVLILFDKRVLNSFIILISLLLDVCLAALCFTLHPLEYNPCNI